LQVAMATPSDYGRLPRAEIRAPAVDLDGASRALNLPAAVEEESEEPPATFPLQGVAGGRPAIQIDPRKVAYYLAYPGGPNAVTRAIAETVLNLKRYAHTAHRDFAAEMYDEIQRLMAARKRANA
jgi:hypothetical protein